MQQRPFELPDWLKRARPIERARRPRFLTALAVFWTVSGGITLTAGIIGLLLLGTPGYNVASAQPHRWRGPYMEGLSADPWGFRYAVNVGLFGGDDGQAVFVLSAGPNGLVETPFAMVGIQQGGDDIVGLIGSAH